MGAFSLDAPVSAGRAGEFPRETLASRCSVSRNFASSFSSSDWPDVTLAFLFLAQYVAVHTSYLTAYLSTTHFSSTVCDRESRPPVPMPRPNMESRSAAKLWATVLVTRECLNVLDCAGGWVTYDSGRVNLDGSCSAILSAPAEEICSTVGGVAE